MSVLDSDVLNFEFEEEPTNVVQGSECELLTYNERYNSVGEKIRLQVGRDLDFDDIDNLGGVDAALVLTRSYDRRGEKDKTTLDIRSIHIQKALRKCIETYPGISLHANPIVIVGDPECLFHYRKELEAYGRTLQDPVAARHIIFILRYMQHCFGRSMTLYRSLVQPTSEPARLDWENLWMVFRPGVLIHHRHADGSILLSRLEKYHRRPNAGPTASIPFTRMYGHGMLTVKSIDFDGRQHGFVTDNLHIKRYDGFKRLDELSAFPLEYHPDASGVMESLIARGKKFLGLCSIQYKAYVGDAAYPNLADEVDYDDDGYEVPIYVMANGPSLNVKGRVMIDSKAFADAYPGASVDFHGTAMGSKITFLEDDGNAGLSDELVATCKHRIPGFSMSERRWLKFNVDMLNDVDFQTNAFEMLLLSRNQKEMIKSLVAVHTNEAQDWHGDVIEGKGKGMIFLLHGPPGVGKTLTAESVADFTRRPLYMISSGDLGVTASTVQEKLSSALALAESWKAVVLIDEADVFLAHRDGRDLKRNAVVSVFLRLLEYYEGILFLTTNRMDSIDAAFLSRIHLAIQYPELDNDSCKALWKSFIQSASRSNDAGENGMDSSPSWLDDDALTKLVSTNLNGRQIRNCVRAAYSLAVSSGTPLDISHIEMATGAMAEFARAFDKGHRLREEDCDEIEAGISTSRHKRLRR